LALVARWAAWLAWRRAELAHNRWLLRAVALAAPMGFIAVEAGWMVTELGRQPWVIYGVLKTQDAVTPMPGLVVPFVTFTLLYCFLGVIVVWLLYRHIIRSPAVPEWRGFYMPPGGGERGGGGSTWRWRTSLTGSYSSRSTPMRRPAAPISAVVRGGFPPQALVGSAIGGWSS